MSVDAKVNEYFNRAKSMFTAQGKPIEGFNDHQFIALALVAQMIQTEELTKKKRKSTQTDEALAKLLEAQ